MNQNELNRAVARVTGETVQWIARMGFGLLPQPSIRRGRRRRIPRCRLRVSRRAQPLAFCLPGA